MIHIRNKQDLEKYKKVRKDISYYEFNDDVVFDVDFKLKGNLICKGEIKGKSFEVDGNVKGKKIVLKNLYCKNLTGNYISVNDLFCKGKISCEMLQIDHITSCEKLKAGILSFNGSMLYNVSAIGENLGDYKCK